MFAAISSNNDKDKSIQSTTPFVYSNLDVTSDKRKFYDLLIKQLQARDLIPFLATVGANLTQNSYFLLENSELWCSTDTCATGLGATLCAVGSVASGIQNTYQRFWKSVMWAWMSRLSAPTALFIHSVNDFIQAKLEQDKENKEAKHLVINISQENLKAIQEEELKSSLDLLQAYYGIGIDLSNDQVESLDIEKGLEIQSLVNDWIYVYENKSSCEKLTENFSGLDLFGVPFLYVIPLGMLMSQTIGMMSKINPHGNENIFIANIVCLLGMLFGAGKWQVNNTLRLKMANDNLRALIDSDSYVKFGEFFFTSIIRKLFYGCSFLIPCISWDLKQAGSNIFSAFVRLFGIFIGVSISLFYLYVGLFTKDGIEFALKTITNDLGVDSQSSLTAYNSIRFYIDVVCVISSLFLNGILTQLPESIKKCDDLAKKIEKWADPSDQTSSPSVSKEVIPVWIHAANVIDICVFALSAMTSIAGLLMLLMESGCSFIVPVVAFLQKMHYAEVAGVCAGVANLIFTYAASAPGQMDAWKLLSPVKEGYEPLLQGETCERGGHSSLNQPSSFFGFSISKDGSDGSCCPKFFCDQRV